jgi:hypothetical protein
LENLKSSLKANDGAPKPIDREYDFRTRLHVTDVGAEIIVNVDGLIISELLPTHICVDSCSSTVQDPICVRPKAGIIDPIKSPIFANQSYMNELDISSQGTVARFL